MVTRVSRRRKRVSKRRKQSGGKRKVSRRRGVHPKKNLDVDQEDVDNEAATKSKNVNNF